MSELGAIYMSTPKNIIDEALSLSVNDKAELVNQLLSAINCLDEDIEKKMGIRGGKSN